VINLKFEIEITKIN